MARKKPNKKRTPATKGVVVPVKPASLLTDLRLLIQQARESVAQVVNSGLVLLYWEIGRRIRVETLKERRASYGEQILSTLSTKLVSEFGNGFGARNLARMISFAEVFPDRQVVAALSGRLSWSHFLVIIPLAEPLQRDFYAEMCRLEHWSVRTACEGTKHAL